MRSKLRYEIEGNSELGNIEFGYLVDLIDIKYQETEKESPDENLLIIKEFLKAV